MPLSTEDQMFLEPEPPPWIARALAVLLLACFVTGVAATVCVPIPETVQGRFVIVPQQQLDPVRAPRDGTISAILAPEGTVIRAGESLCRLRSPVIGQLAGELDGVVVQLASAQQNLELAEENHRLRCEAEAEEVCNLNGRLKYLEERHAHLLKSRQHQSEITTQACRIAAENVASLKVKLISQENVVRLTAENASRAKSLLSRQVIPTSEANDLAVAAEKTQGDRNVTASELQRAELLVTQLDAQRNHESEQWELQRSEVENDQRQNKSALEKLRRESLVRDSAYAQTVRTNKELIDRLTVRRAALTRELKHSHGDELDVTAPREGTVVRWRRQATGTFVEAADVLCELAPVGSPLVADVRLPPERIGRIHPGQGVKLLLDAFPYQRFGVRTGQVKWVSPATVEIEGTQVFPLRAEFATQPFVVDGQPQPLRVGMGGNVRIVVGRRVLATYLFEPLRQLRENLSDVPRR